MAGLLPSAHHLIIAGTVKGGTTSLFDYLSRHPAICPSDIKETEHFLTHRYGEPARPAAAYSACFARHAGQRWTMEATPGYLDGGRAVAEAVRAAVPDARIVFVLRDPVDRCLSFFRFKQAMLEVPADLDLAGYLARCDAIPPEQRGTRANNPWWGVEGGRYARSLAPWFEAFPAAHIRVVFFDELVRDPRGVLAELCAWLGLEPLAGSVALGIENKTRSYRLRGVHGLALWLNRRSEGWLRRNPRLKAALRRIYYSINEGARPEAPEAEALAALRARYATPNAELVALLRQRGYRDLPGWLAEGADRG